MADAAALLGRLKVGRPSNLGTNYRVERQVGRGPVAAVYEATDLKAGRTIAVKLIDTRYTREPRFAVRFRRALKQISQVTHANLAVVHDYGHHDGSYFVASEWVRGRHLGGVLEQRGALMPQEAVEIGRQICGALTAAHEQGQLHLGLKPQNVLLTAEHKVKVTDLGLSAVISESGLSKTGLVLSGAPYMSPEQAMGERLGPQSDVYSVGVMLFEMLTGRQPFEAHTSWSLLRRQVEEIPAQPSQLNSHVPFDLGAAVMIALRKEPGGRYATAADLEAALRQSKIHAAATPPLVKRPRRALWGLSRSGLAGWQGLLSRASRQVMLLHAKRWRPLLAGLAAALLIGATLVVSTGALSALSGLASANSSDQDAVRSAGVDEVGPARGAAADEAAAGPLPNAVPPTPGPAENGRVEFRAEVEAISASIWTIGGRQVHIDGRTEFKGNGVIAVGDTVDVLATVGSDGSLTALKIDRRNSGSGEGESGEEKFEGFVGAMGPEAWIIGGRRVIVTGETKIEGDIGTGDFVEVEVQVRADGSLVAKEIERDD